MRWLSGDPYYDMWTVRGWFMLLIVVIDWAVVRIWRPLSDWIFMRDIRRHKRPFR